MAISGKLLFWSTKLTALMAIFVVGVQMNDFTLHMESDLVVVFYTV